jgi:hypothetical protein
MAPDIRDDVSALVRDLLPILVPGATFDAASAAVLLPVADRHARVSIQPLVSACRSQPQHLWPRMVDAWLTDVRIQIADADADEALPSLDQLRVQIAPRQPEDELAGQVVRPFGSAFDARVVVDHSGRVAPLTTRRATALGLDPDRAVETAIRQTIVVELQHLAAREHRIGDATLHLVARDGSPYVTAVLLSVARFVPGPAPHGILVAAPRFSAVVLHRVESVAALNVAVIIARLAGQMYRDAPDPCTDRVFWWLDGTLHPIDVTDGEDPERPRLTLPPDLAPVVDRLPDD